MHRQLAETSPGIDPIEVAANHEALAVAVITAPRTPPTLEPTLVSLREGGFTQTIHVFAEPDSLPVGWSVPGVQFHQNSERLGLYPNWLNAARWLVSNTDLPYLLLCEDDVEFCAAAAAGLWHGLTTLARIGWKVLLCSLPIVLPMFVAAAFILSLVQIPLQQWFEPAGIVAALLSQASIVLTLCIMLGFKWSMGRSEIESQPLVPWILAIPMSLLLAIGLLVLYNVCYVASFVVLRFGLAEVYNLPKYLHSYWRTNDALQVSLVSVRWQPITALAFLITLLFAYYGPVSEEFKDFFKEIWNAVFG